MGDLITQNRGLVYHFCKKYRFRPDYKDLLQEGFAGLCESADRFDESRKIKFSTYAYLRVRGSIIDYINRKSSVIKTPAKELPYTFLPLDAPLFGVNWDLCLAEILADDNNDLTAEQIVLDDFIQTLDDFEKDVYRLMSVGYGVREISKLLHLPVKDINAAFEKILSKADDFGVANGYKKSCIRQDAAVLK